MYFISIVEVFACYCVINANRVISLVVNHHNRERIE
jgi:hypothetical protein